MLKKPVWTKRSLFLALLACSTLGWFLLFRLQRQHLGKHEEISAPVLSAIRDTGDYMNLTPPLPRIQLDDIRSADDLLDARAALPDAIPLEPDPAAVVAIVPVTEDSLGTLSQNLARFLPLSGLLHEIILLCPSALSPGVRDLVRETLSEEDEAHIDISISTWLSGLEEGTAILSVARQIAADRVLVFDSSSLDGLNDDVLEMLASPLLTPLPVGSRGFNVTGDSVSCIHADDSPKAAAFLVPPFSVSATLIPPHDLVPTPVYDIWKALGWHISRARFEGIGGIVLDSGAADTLWCPSAEAAHPSPNPMNEDLETALTPSDSKPDPSDAYDACSAGAGGFTFIFTSERQLQSFSPALCRIQGEGHVFRTTLLADGIQQPTVKRTALSHCNVALDVLQQDAAQLDTWLVAASCAPTAVLISGLETAVSDALVRAIERKYGPDTTLVRIPEQDLPYCDWMGSLGPDEWRNWATPQLEISVITDDRPHSLDRLLSSLSAAHFFGDAVTLRINVEQTAGPQTLQLINDFFWPHGPVFVHRRVIHGGLLPAVVESWYPRSNDSYGLMLEDDVELSPLFYAWVKMAVLRYRYGASKDKSPQLFGISLYQQKNLELRPEGRHRFNARTTFASASLPHSETPYVSQIPCSWGAVYFPEHWREFHDYLAVRLSGAHPRLPAHGLVAPGVRSNRWTRSWKKFFIELAYLRGYVMLYPNYADYLSLSTNHLEVGSHVKPLGPAAYERKKRLFRLPLLRPPAHARSGAPGALETGLMDLPAARMPAWAALPVLDLLGLLATEAILQERGLARRAELFRCADAPHGPPPADLRSFLCLDAPEVE